MMKRARLLILCALLLPATLAMAQSTGKIAGQVTDAQSGVALPGVNVILDGTNIGSTTDAEGFYNILNVTAGTYDVRATFIGYAPSLVQDVGVNIGLTTELNIELQEEAVGLEEVIVTAEAPIIQRDISGSQRNIGSEEIQAGRFQNINNVLSAQVSTGATGLYNDRPRIRASSMEESKFIVDGVDQNDAISNRPYQRVNLDAVEEVQVLTGGFSAEYGNMRSGVVNVVTKSGGERYSGSANVQYSAPALKHFGPMPYGHESSIARPFVDPEAGAFTGNNFFPGWNAEAANPSRDPQHTGNPEELWMLWMWRHRSQDSIDQLKEFEQQGLVQFAPGVDPDDEVYHQTGDMPDYTASFTLGGPIPGLSAVKFFTSYDQTQSEYASTYPQPAYIERNFRGKLTTNLSQNTRLNLHGFWATQKGGDGGQGPGTSSIISSNPFRQYDATNKFWYPNCSVPGQQTRQIYGAQLTHTFNANTFLEMDFAHNRVDYKMINQIRNTAPIPAVEGQTSLLQGLIGSDEQIAAWSDQGSPDYVQGYENWQEWAKIKIGDYWYDEGPKHYSPIWWVDVTGYFRMSSCNVRSNDTYSRSYDFKSSITSQVNRNNQVKAGIQVRLDDVYQDYRALDPSVNGGSIQLSDAAPWMVGVYVTDKLEYRGFVANVGLRLDGFIGGEFPVLDGPAGADNSVYSTFLLSGQTTRDGADGEVEYAVQDLIPERRVNHWRLSPRIGISHPITTVAKIFFNYGHMYQRPDLEQLYRIQFNTQQGNRVAAIGNPLVEPPRTIQYEVGYEHNLFNRMNLQITGYYKDINNEISTVDYIPLGQSAYDRYENLGFKDVRGLETSLELRRGALPYISGFVSANYLIESGGQFGFNQYFEDPTAQPNPVSTEISDPDVRPIFRGGLTFSTPHESGFSLLGGFDLSLLYFWQRGQQFTWNPGEIPLVQNNVRWKPYQRWDLRLQKSLFQRGTLDAQFYVDVTNLFNNRNLTSFIGSTINDENISNREEFAWNGMTWYSNTDRDYMYSLGLTPENQNEDGSFNTDNQPGDWDLDEAQLPPWDSFRFLEKRDIFFGVRFNF